MLKKKFQRFGLVFILLASVNTVLSQSNFARENQLIIKGRMLFYEAVENESKIDSALQIFEQIKNLYSNLNGRAQVYIGALNAVKAKHAFWPHDKLYYANKGLDMMDHGLMLKQDDIESLFVQGSICYNLPFFFNRNSDALKNFKQIIQLLPEKKHLYDSQLIADIVRFLNEEIELSASDAEALNKMNNYLTTNKKNRI
jgi:hypothetical protein